MGSGRPFHSRMALPMVGGYVVARLRPPNPLTVDGGVASALPDIAICGSSVSITTHMRCALTRQPDRPAAVEASRQVAVASFRQPQARRCVLRRHERPQRLRG